MLSRCPRCCGCDEQIHMDCRSPVEKKGQHGHSLSERATGFYCFLVALHQGRSSFIMHRFASGDYLLQITKKRMLQMQGKKWLNWLHSIPGRFSRDFRKLLQRYAVNICCLNSEWGIFSKSKPQSSLDIMQAWFPVGKRICGPGSWVPPCTCQFSEPGLSYINHCHKHWFPIFPI